MNNIFLTCKDNVYNYDELIEQLNNKKDYSDYIYVKDNEPYEVFLKIIHSMMCGYKVEIIDGDLSDCEISEIGIQYCELHLTKKINNKVCLSNYNDLISEIYNHKNSFEISIYTSGTTGRPKKVTHKLDTIARNVKIDDRFKNDIWGFAYNPTHIAGLQVLFQALFNRNEIVYIFGDEKTKIKYLLDNYKITNISATATYYRNILPYLCTSKFDSVKNVTFGGEKCDVNLIEKVKKVFSKAKINNIYASTEAGSLFNSNGEVFIIKKETRQFVKINENNELLIHNSLLGRSEYFSLVDGWYNTNDVVEKIDENSFSFVSRKSEFINVGGYKVNPFEIENILRDLDEIKDIVVYARENSVTGKVIVADIVRNGSLNDKLVKIKIKEYASEKLQPWKIPRIIKFVDKIEETRTGKKVRK